MKILVAEDDPSILDIIELVLTTQGHELVKAKDGADCIGKFNGEDAGKPSAKPTFDLVIVDWSMPQLSGLDVIKEILEHNPYQKIILTTAYSKDDLSRVGDFSDKIKVIHKPFDVDALIEVVSSFK